MKRARRIALAVSLAACPAIGLSANPVDPHIYAQDTARQIGTLVRPGTALVVGMADGYYQLAVIAQLRSLGFTVIEDGSRSSGMAASFALNGAAPGTAARVRLTVGTGTWTRAYDPAAGRPTGPWSQPQVERAAAAVPAERDQLYQLGRSVEAKAPERALSYYRLAADLGQLDASLRLGLLLVAREKAGEGLRYLALASDAGNPQAQYVLGLAYLNGSGIRKDAAAGRSLLSRSAAAGVTAARQALSGD